MSRYLYWLVNPLYIEFWIIYLCFFAHFPVLLTRIISSRRAVIGVSFLMMAFILRPGVRSMRTTLTCRAKLIANRFIDWTILLEFNTILCVRRWPSKQWAYVSIIINALYSHVNFEFINNKSLYYKYCLVSFLLLLPLQVFS